MTDLKIELLSILYHNAFQSERISDIVNRFPKHATDVHYALKDLFEDGLINLNPPQDRYTITKAGRLAYESAQEERNQHAEEKRLNRTQTNLQVAQVLISLLTFIIGLIVEHFTNFFGFLIDLF